MGFGEGKLRGEGERCFRYRKDKDILLFVFVENLKDYVIFF